MVTKHPPTISRYWFTGTGRNCNFPNNRVVVWNDVTNQPETEISINTPILSFKVSTPKVLVILCARKLFVYDLPEIKLRHSLDLNYSKISYQLVHAEPYLCYQPLDMGQVSTEICSNIPRRVHRFPTHSRRPSPAISQQGGYILAVSLTGVVVKLFDSSTGNLVQEYRRGLPANAFFLKFSSRDRWLIYGTDDGSVHIF